MSVNGNRLYNDLAWTWPIISPPENYLKEADEAREMLMKHSQIPVKTVLNLGCGGGHDDFGLKRYFEVTGVDISPSMLTLARKLNPEITYLEGDMRTVRLGRTFDAVVCFDSIDYMRTEYDLRAVFKTAWDHLKPGGVFFTYAEVTKESFRQNKTSIITKTEGKTEIVFIENYYDEDPSDTCYQSTFIYLIRKNGELIVETDQHSLGIFPHSTWPEALQQVGFKVTEIISEADPDNYPDLPTFICLKQV